MLDRRADWRANIDERAGAAFEVDLGTGVGIDFITVGRDDLVFSDFEADAVDRSSGLPLGQAMVCTALPDTRTTSGSLIVSGSSR